ncbi:MAG: DUF1993 domain-containing protein [Methylobacteriaceae bacterium]|nr:DUF1993 domain-containing protein [Methylobacteriaceae bacterium]
MSMYIASIPAFVRTLEALSGVLDKAAAYCAARKIEPEVLAGTRLFPNMFALARQVQLSSDFAKNGASRLAGIDPPKFEDAETTLDALKERIAKTIAYVKSIDPKQIDASAGRDVVFPQGPNKMKTPAENFLFNVCLPNFYFHATTAYAILRQSGVEIGKRDYLGSIPDLSAA